MNKLTVIIPLHNISQVIAKDLTKALNSFKHDDVSEIILVGDEEIIKQAQEQCFKGEKKLVLVNSKSETPFGKINDAVMQCTTPYFSVLEYDDEYTEFYFNEAFKYIKEYGSSVIIPLNLYNNYGVEKETNFLGFANEIALDKGMCEQLGVVTEDVLMCYYDFTGTGTIFNTEDFISVGMLSNDKTIVTWYDLYMRFARSNKEIRVIPKIGYVHNINRDDCYYKQITNGLTPEIVTNMIKEVKGVENNDEEKD